MRLRDWWIERQNDRQRDRKGEILWKEKCREKDFKSSLFIFIIKVVRETPLSALLIYDKIKQRRTNVWQNPSCGLKTTLLFGNSTEPSSQVFFPWMIQWPGTSFSPFQSMDSAFWLQHHITWAIAYMTTPIAYCIGCFKVLHKISKSLQNSNEPLKKRFLASWVLNISDLISKRSFCLQFQCDIWTHAG